MQGEGCKAQQALLPWSRRVTKPNFSRMVLESPGRGSETLVGERVWPFVGDLEYHGAR